LKEKLSGFHCQYNDQFSNDGKVILCNVFEKTVKAKKKYDIDQHVGRKCHQDLLVKFRKKNKQKKLFLSEIPSKSDRYIKIFNALIFFNIPFNALKDEKFRDLIKKKTENLPEESTIRKNYLPKVFEKNIDSIREIIGNNQIWVSIDETTDEMKRHVAGICSGILDDEQENKSYLVNVTQLYEVNSSTIARLFNDAMGELFQNKFHHEKFLLFVTDGAPYMNEAARDLKPLYPKLIHLTCMDHMNHRVAETVRATFKNVDQLILNVK